MKKILILLFFPLILHAESYTFSGGKGNTVHIIASQILIKAYARAGIEVAPLFLTLSDSLESSNNGETDGELARISEITKNYPNLRRVPVSIIYVEAVAFSKNRSLRIKKWSDLQGHKVTIVRGSKFIEMGTKNIVNKEFVDNISEALKHLVKDEAEIIVMPKLAGLSQIHKNKYKYIKEVSPTLKKMKLYHFVHKKNSHLISIITPVLKKMEQSGEISYMRGSYLSRYSNSLFY